MRKRLKGNYCNKMKNAIDLKRNLIDHSIIDLIQDIKNLIKRARHNAFTAVNAEMLKAYFEIGRKIVEEEQK